jgi:eukaryotic-like serine/threonine-protein kinase
MNSDRWEQINRLWDAALEVPEEERPAFLERNCQGDAELRREVESLLFYELPAQPFIELPAIEVAPEKPLDEPPSLVGQKLGPYHIQSVLGAGGMGEVYRARDARLNRMVAIKVLPKHFSQRSDLKQRFEREAQAVASLNHPHICALYDVGKQAETNYLVMEYLEGETLSQRLKRGALPTGDVLRYGVEMTGALDTAHRKGVIHRDLKPANIMLTETGAKLLDFGLAKQNRPPLTSGDFRGVSGTEGKNLTEEGMILGTLEYMAPEQLEGKQADARTDIFALGVVIYEMATGRKAFEGDSKASLIAKILTFQPPAIQTIQPVSPPELDPVVRRCLAKNPEDRWQSAAHVTAKLLEVERALPNPRIGKSEKQPDEGAKNRPDLQPVGPAATSRPALSQRIRARGRMVILIGFPLAFIVTFFLVWRLWRQEKPAEKPKEISLKPLTSYSAEHPVDYVAISPDGKYLAFCSMEKLFMQTVSSGESRAIPLPEGFRIAAASWFPDSTRLLLRRSEEMQRIQVKGEEAIVLEESLWSLSILGGPPQKIVDHAAGPYVTLFDSPSVSPDGSLVAFNRNGPEGKTVELWVVGTNGEQPHKVRAPSAPNQGYFGPVWSSSGQRLFYLRDEDDARSIESCDLRGEQVTNIFPSKGAQKYPAAWEAMHSLCWIPDGRILVSMQQNEPANAMKVGDVFNLWEIKVDPLTGRALSEGRQITQWSGYSTAHANSLSVTADGKKLVLRRDEIQADVYVAEVEQGGKAMKNLRRLTMVQSNDDVSDWTADSRAIFFTSDRNGTRDLFKQEIDKTDAETLVVSPEFEWHPNLSPDGAFILYLVSRKPGAETRLMRVPTTGGPPQLVLSGEKILNFSCAREAKLCVVVEQVDGKQVLTAFDPLKGRGEKLAPSDYPHFGAGILSPQGRLVEQMTSSADGLYIRIRSFRGDARQEISFPNLMGVYFFAGWSLDGKGMYLQTSDFTCVYAGLDGHHHVFWKRGAGPVWAFSWPIFSPNGRHLASTVLTNESNAWLLENF